MKTENWEKIVFFFTALLGLILVLTFVLPKKYVEKKFRTAYLSNDLAKNIDEINLINGDFLLNLKKNTNWTALLYERFPADKEAIESFISVLVKIREANEVSKKKESWKKLGVDENAFIVELFCGSDVPIRLYFGKRSMGNSLISFRTDKSVCTYQSENDIASFLQTDPSFWCDPYLIAKDERNAENVQLVSFGKMYKGSSLKEIAKNLLSLRRGLLCTKNEDIEKNKADSVLETNFLDGDTVRLSFFNADSLYVVKSEIKKENIVYWYEISAWTYQKIQEIFTNNDDKITASTL